MNSFDAYKKTVERQVAPTELVEKTVTAVKKREKPEKKRRMLWRPVAIAACAALVLAVSVSSLLRQNQFPGVSSSAEMEAESASQEGSASQDSLSSGTAGILKKSWTPEQFAEETGVDVWGVLDGYRLESADITALCREDLEVTSALAELTFADGEKTAELTLEYNAAAGNKYHVGEPYLVGGTAVYFSENSTEDLQYAWFERDGIEWLVSARGLGREAFTGTVEKILE